MTRAPYSQAVWEPDSSATDHWADDSGGHLTLARAVALFVAAKAAEGVSPRTIEYYEMVLGRATRGLGPGRRIDSITAPEVRAWVLGLRETLAPISVAGYVRGVKAFGNWLAAEELAAASAFRTLRRPKVPLKVIEPVADDVVLRLLGLANVRDKAVVLLLLDTGLRLSEIAELRIRDLRPDGSVKVMGKGARERIVPVGATARHAVTRYLAQRRAEGPDDFVFLGKRGPLERAGIYQVLKRLKDRAGISGRLSPHSLRHTFAPSYIVNRGDVFSLQRILGHSTLDMVKRYVALADADVAARHKAASPADRLIIGARGAAQEAPFVSPWSGRRGAGRGER